MDAIEDWNDLAEEDFVFAVSGQSERYEFERNGLKFAADVVRRMSRNGGNVVLDLGCGVGRISKYISWSCKRVHAVDSSPRMLEVADRYLPDGAGNVSLHLAEDEELSFLEPESIDFAFSWNCFIHCPSDVIERYLSSVHRVLKPGCAFYFNCHALESSPAARANRVINVPVERMAEFAEGWTDAEIRVIRSRFVNTFVK